MSCRINTEPEQSSSCAPWCSYTATRGCALAPVDKNRRFTNPESQLTRSSFVSDWIVMTYFPAKHTGDFFLHEVLYRRFLALSWTVRYAGLELICSRRSCSLAPPSPYDRSVLCVVHGGFREC